MIFARGRELHVLIATGLWILEDLSFVVPDHDLLVIVIEDVTGIDRHLPAASRRVDHELRHAVAGGVAAQAFNDFDAFRD